MLFFYCHRRFLAYEFFNISFEVWSTKRQPQREAIFNVNFEFSAHGNILSLLYIMSFKNISLPYSSNKELIIMKHVSVNFVAIKFKSISMLLHRVVPGKGNKWSAFHVKPEDMIIMIMKVHVIMNLIVLFMHKLISL